MDVLLAQWPGNCSARKVLPKVFLLRIDAAKALGRGDRGYVGVPLQLHCYCSNHVHSTSGGLEKLYQMQ